MTGLSRAGYYRWRLPPRATPVEMELRDQMQQVAVESPAYGYRRITAELKRRGFAVNHKHVLRLCARTTCCACGVKRSWLPPIRVMTFRCTRTWHARFCPPQ